MIIETDDYQDDILAKLKQLPHMVNVTYFE